MDLDDIGYLYIIRDEKKSSPWIKVGKTINPIGRLAQYNSSFPEDRMTYSYLSEPIYNLKEAEEKLLELLESDKNLVKSRKEWFKHSSPSGSRLVDKMIRHIESLVNTYYYIKDEDNIEEFRCKIFAFKDQPTRYRR